MKKWKKIAKQLGYSVLGLCALSAAAWFVPFPIEGNWVAPYFDADEGAYGFLRFENGKVLGISEKGSAWLGTYQRKGWGKYEVSIFNFTLSNKARSFDPYMTLLFRSTLLRAKSDSYEWCEELIRNPRILTCRKIANAPINDWLHSFQEISIRITGTTDERLFVWGTEKKLTAKEQEDWLNHRLFEQPLKLLLASNGTPFRVSETLTPNGVEYHVHSNQYWVASDTNQIDFIEWQKRNLELSLHTRKVIKTSLYLYVKDGILPEDVRQMLEPFDLNYHVRDERILYRGKTPLTKKTTEK